MLSFILKGFLIIVYNETIIIKCYTFSLNFPIGFKGVFSSIYIYFFLFFLQGFWKIDIHGSQERIRSRGCVTNINLILISPLCHLCNLRLNVILWLVYGFHNPHTIDVIKLYIYMRKMNENLVSSSILLSLAILSTCNTLHVVCVINLALHVFPLMLNFLWIFLLWQP
jgi:hypothetical protein